MSFFTDSRTISGYVKGVDINIDIFSQPDNISRKRRELLDEKLTTSRVREFKTGEKVLNYDFVKNNTSLHETEISFGEYTDKSFQSKVPFIEMDRLKSWLEYHNFNKKETNTVDIINGEYIKTEDLDTGNVLYKTKKKAQIIEFKELNIRVRKSIETNISEPVGKSFTPLSKNVFTRKKTRTEYSFTDKKSESMYEMFSKWRFDLTNVNNSYEVEIESLETKKFVDPPEKLYLFIKMVMKGVVDYRAWPKFDLKGNLLDVEKIILSSEERKVMLFWNNNFGSEGNMRNFKSIKNKPENFKISDISNNELMAISYKYDGLRRFLVNVDNNSYLLDTYFESLGHLSIPRHVIKKVKETVTTKNSIYDGEYIEDINSFFVFDCLVFNSELVTDSNFIERYNYISFPENKTDDDSLKVLKKPFIFNKRDPGVDKKYESFTELFPTQIELEKDNQVSLTLKNKIQFLLYNKNKYYLPENVKDDGFIFNYTNGTYSSNLVKKWKPVDKLSIDFYLEKVEDGKFEIFLYDRSTKMIKFKGDNNNKFKGIVNIPEESILDEYKSKVNIDRKVVEMVWSTEKETFIPLRIRFDKSLPNFVSVGYTIWKDIHNPIKMETLLGEDYKHPRYLINRLKEKILLSSSNITSMIDIGSGQGGDVSKWKQMIQRGSVKKIFAVEPSTVMIKELKSRIRSAKIEKYVKIIQAGGEETDKIVSTIKKEGYEKVDAIFSFFSLAFFGKSKDSYEGLKNTIISCLSSNGIFKGIFIDGDKVSSLLKHVSSYKNKIFSIKRGPNWNINSAYGKDFITDIPGSYVRDVTDYIFTLKQLKNMHPRLETKKIKVLDVKNQTDGQRDFTKLNIVFSMQMSEKNNMDLFPLTPLVDSLSKKIVVNDLEDIEFERHKIPQGPNCFFSSFLYSTLFNIKDYDQEQIIKDTKEFRTTILGTALTQDRFKNIDGGDMELFFMNLLLKKEGKTKIDPNALSIFLKKQQRRNYKNKLKEGKSVDFYREKINELDKELKGYGDEIKLPDSVKKYENITLLENEAYNLISSQIKDYNFWLSREISSILEEMAKVNILILKQDDETNIVDFEINKNYNKERSSIILLFYKNMFYEPVSISGYYIFNCENFKSIKSRIQFGI